MPPQPDHASAADAYERDALKNFLSVANKETATAVLVAANAAAQVQMLMAISHRLADLTDVLRHRATPP